MADFTTEEIERAAKRVREMYARSSFKNELPPMPNFVAPTPEKRHEKPVLKNNKSRLLGLLNFKNFPLDSDTSLLLGIILLLSSEIEDELLILALVYIML